MEPVTIFEVASLLTLLGHEEKHLKLSCQKKRHKAAIVWVDGRTEKVVEADTLEKALIGILAQIEEMGRDAT